MAEQELTLEQLEEEVANLDETAHVPPADIAAFNELRSCADLYRMYNQKILDLQPDFQRDFIWRPSDQTRFIDSLIKQLPIPSMCFANDYKAQRWIVIDGLQRISTIVRFLEGGDWNLSLLDDVDPDLAGKSVAAIKTATDKLHAYYTRVENLTIPITVIRCDFNKKSHMDYLFTIFHRLNTGGAKLNNQEIRNCIYGGALNDLLKELDLYPSWRKLNGMKDGDRQRFTKQELILRLFSFYDHAVDYQGNLAGFMNGYMQANRNPGTKFLSDKAELFKKTADCIYEKIFSSETPPKLSISVTEGLLYAIAKNISKVGQTPAAQLQQRYQELIASPDYSESALREGLAKKPRVQTRLSTAETIFSR